MGPLHGADHTQVVGAGLGPILLVSGEVCPAQDDRHMQWLAMEINEREIKWTMQSLLSTFCLVSL